jgi:pyruvyl transferase EpsO
MNHTMTVLKDKLQGILEYIEDKNDVIYLDYPFHHNVGDLLIYQGAIKFFAESDVTFKLLRNAHDYSLSELTSHITPKTTILCHGGGNFGDIYRLHQAMREDVVANFPNNRIIILPQTAFFSSDEALEESAKCFRKNKNVVIYSRDTRSVEVFNKFTDNVYLMPDMAHHLYGLLERSGNKKNEKLYFLRIDCEVSPEQEKLNLDSSIKTLDWIDVLTGKDIFIRKVLTKLMRLSIKTNSGVLKDLVAKAWVYNTWGMTNKYSKLFSGYSEVITSRMHGHILSCLVDTDNILVDNSYGKNQGYYNEWTYPIKNARLLSQ